MQNINRHSKIQRTSVENTHARNTDFAKHGVYFYGKHFSQIISSRD